LKRVIIAGTNGMIGSLILQACLERSDVVAVTSITRKAVGIQHPKLKEVLHPNFLDFTAIENVFANQDICFYCLGVYTGQVSTEAFKKITVAFTQSFAHTLKTKNGDAVFCFLSGQGADSAEKSKILFAREKGIAENALLKLNFARTHLFRPGYIYPITPRKEPNFFYTLMRVLYKPISFIYPNIGVSSQILANSMLTHIAA
jgi:nucleoside-diphosphate-sugar epimerase